MGIFRRVRKSVGKKFRSTKKGVSLVAHAAADQIFDEFPNCPDLLKTNKISIKMDLDLKIYTARSWRWVLNNDNAFENINFLIRNEEKKKATFMTATVKANNGMSIKTAPQKQPIMVIRKPNKTENCIGKLMHPGPISIYKVMKDPNSSYCFVCESLTMEPKMIIEKRDNWVANFFAYLDRDYCYRIKTVEGETLGYIRPKMVVNSETLILKFKRHCDVQDRATMLGVAALFVMTEAYTEIGNMLGETFKENK